MYLHHQRERNAKPAFGWLGTMDHGLIQATPSTRPCILVTLWMYNVRLVSHPYYTKHAVPGDVRKMSSLDS